MTRGRQTKRPRVIFLNNSANNNEQNIPYTAFVIITTNANAEMSTIHPRMPVIFHKDKANQWLDDSINDISQLKNLLAPYPDSLILKKTE